MIRHCVRSLLLVAALLAISASIALAKGAPPKITISGPGLANTVEVADWEGMGCIAPGALFHMGESITAPQVGAGYDVVRYALSATGSYQPFDRLHYYVNATSGLGYVFYDGPGAFGGQTDSDGKWFDATPLGDSAMQQLLRKLGVSVARPLPPINLADACGQFEALEPGERFDRATVSGPGLSGAVAITDPVGLSVLGQPLLQPFWQTSWNVRPQFATAYEIAGYYKNGDAYLGGGTLRYYPHPAGGRSFILYNGVWFAISPQTDNALRGVLKSLGATFAASAAAQVATATLDAAAPQIIAGRKLTLGFMVQEPGNAPADADLVLVYLSSEYKQSVASVFVARPDGPPGHYSVEISLPAAGSWYFWVVWGPFNEQVEMTPLLVIDPVPAGNSGMVALDPVQQATPGASSVPAPWAIMAAVAVLLGAAGLLLIRIRTRSR
jgi:hypothetical protein